jgi:hypothetical protein
MTDVDLNFLARQNERILVELRSMRDEMVTMREDIEKDIKIMSAMLRRMESWMRRTDDENPIWNRVFPPL